MSENLITPSVKKESDLLESEYICRPTQWFIRRALAMFAMFLFFTLWFFKDGQWTYKKENLIYYMHQLFANQVVNQATAENYESEQKWVEFATAQRVPFPEDAIKILPKGTELDQPWPQEAIGAYGNDDLDVMWEAYTRRVGLDSDVKEEPHTARQIREQFIFSGLCGVLSIGVLFIFLRTLRRRMRVDDVAYYAPSGQTVNYAAMHRIDARKWKTKGVATICYKDSQGGEKKVKVDGLVYGDFKKEEGEPAEKLYQKILSHFEGEILEYEQEEAELEVSDEKEGE